MVDLDRLQAELLQECKEDHVGLWTFLWVVRHALNDGAYPTKERDKADPTEVRRLSLELVRRLLKSGLVQAGFPTADGRGFVPWRMAPADVLKRIEAEWNGLGHEPNMGDIVWFTTPEVPGKVLA